jgi:hypothetical protein
MIEKVFILFGYKKHVCSNCKKTNYFKDKADFETIAGFCRKCNHPVWYDNYQYMSNVSSTKNSGNAKLVSAAER